MIHLHNFKLCDEYTFMYVDMFELCNRCMESACKISTPTYIPPDFAVLVLHSCYPLQKSQTR